MALKNNQNNENEENKKDETNQNQTPANDQNKKNEDHIIIDKNGNVVDPKQKKGLKKWVKVAIAIGALLVIAGGVVYIVYKGKHIPVAVVEKTAEVAPAVVEAISTAV